MTPSMKLFRYGRSVETIFDLLGTKEDDMTYALGYVLSRSSEFAETIVGEFGSSLRPSRDGVVRLQQVNDAGRTDVELVVPGTFAAVFEAKRGTELPSEAQLLRYVPWLSQQDAPTKFFVAVTNAPQQYAELTLPPNLRGVPVRHMTWRRVRDLARRAHRQEGHKNKALLKDFADYLGGLLGMETMRSNLVYVVSLNNDRCWGIGNRAVVSDHGRYFYPATGSGGWPAPPNYIAFRFDGRLQSIHHVEGWQIFTRPPAVLPGADDTVVEPHYLLKLGPPIKPPHEVKNGDRVVRANRVWCMIDLLLTCSTISEALDATERRLATQSSQAPDTASGTGQ